MTSRATIRFSLIKKWYTLLELGPKKRKVEIQIYCVKNQRAKEKKR